MTGHGRSTSVAESQVVVGYSTLQFHSGGLFDSRPVDGYMAHLVRKTARGTPGPTLCGLDRFAPGSAGWSVEGGVTGRGIKHAPCPGCDEARDLSLPVTGLGAKSFEVRIGPGQVGAVGSLRTTEATEGIGHG